MIYREALAAAARQGATHFRVSGAHGRVLYRTVSGVVEFTPMERRGTTVELARYVDCWAVLDAWKAGPGLTIPTEAQRVESVVTV